MEKLEQHIQKSFQRLSEKEYQIEQLFQAGSYGWPGDWEGRALLAFVSLWHMTGEKIPAMDAFVEQAGEKLNSKGYFGKEFKDLADEQQLSGHSWLLRGLVAYYEAFDSEKALDMADRIVENLYLPVSDWYLHYPLEKRAEAGGVSGDTISRSEGWLLSTDVGCAFMCLDGLAHYYAVRPKKEVKELIDRIISCFVKTDKVEMKVQTHATLSAARGIMRMYLTTKKTGYLDLVLDTYRLYLECGMTENYENFNWFGRKDTWTEPCAVVDSLILAIQLCQLTGDAFYRTLARRIWFNGMRFEHRDNGGAGTNACLSEENRKYQILGYEAAFCCTMRYCEGLKYLYDNYGLFAENGTEITVDERGRKFRGDVLLIRDQDGNEIEMVTNIENRTAQNAVYTL